MVLESSRLVLVASSAEHVRTELERPESLGALLGAGGYFGPPGVDGTVEIGYSVLPEWQRRGYASEIVQTLVAHAFTFPQVNRVIAHTSGENIGSINVLEADGFLAVGAGEAVGILRFELARTRS